MKWCTPISIPSQKGYLQHGIAMILMGSCFADNIGSYLMRGKFDIVTNPFGTLYNPASIAGALKRLIEHRKYSLEELRCGNNLWYSYHHHGKFSQATSEETLSGINRAYSEAIEMLPRCQRLIITFGTAYLYKLRENNEVVANCHKQPAALFERTKMSVEEVVACWDETLQLLWQHTPQCEVLFTVSPIRHLSDGAHENQLSKSTLLLATDILCHKYPDRCRYFPAYEIVLDELRDYRFYAADMTHPSTQAVEYIASRLAETYFTDETMAIVEQCNRIGNGLQHRPLYGTNNEQYKTFATKLLQQMETVENACPGISYETERMQLKQLISQ